MSPAWEGTIACRTTDPSVARWLAQALGPEVAREVPRARARVDLRSPTEVVLEVRASETGPLRAALNTYLGWIHLSIETLGRAHDAEAPPPP